MPITELGNQSRPQQWSPSGVVDSIDGGKTMPGAMLSLSNLVPSKDTLNQWVGRPPAILLPGSQVISLTNGTKTMGQIYGGIVYGRYFVGIAQSIYYTGYDVPFVYDLIAQAYITISGITASNIPISYPLCSTWNATTLVTKPYPPCLAGIGVKVIICHPGYSASSGNGGASACFGYIDFSNPTAPVYNDGNTTVNTLPYQPVFVANFNQRAFYAMNPPTASGVQPSIMASDVNSPLVVTNGGYTVSFGDTTPISGMGGLPLTNQLGGVIQSLIVFKGQANVYQISGDFALNNLFVNSLDVAVGTVSNDSITPTTQGLAFCAQDGMRIIQFNGTVTPVIGADGKGISTPLINSANQQQIVAASLGTNMRVCGPGAGGTFFDYIYEFSTNTWHGPHTFPAYLAMGAYASSYIFGGQNQAGIWSLNTLQLPAVSYTEGNNTAAQGAVSLASNSLNAQTLNLNGTIVTFGVDVTIGANSSITAGNLYTFLSTSVDPNISQCTYTNRSGSGLANPGVSITFKSTGPAGNAWTMATSNGSNIKISGPNLVGGQTATALAFNWQTTNLPVRDDLRNCASVLSIIYGTDAGNPWTVTAADQAGTAINSVSLTAPTTGLASCQVPWTAPLVFDKVSVTITGTLSANTRLGDWYMEYQTLGYVSFGYPY